MLFRSVFVAHPIQDRSDDELRALADAALPAILQRLVAAGADERP